MTSERHAPISLRDLLTHLDWRQELLGVALVIAEAFPIYLFVSLMLNPTNRVDPFSFGIVLFLLLVAHVVSRLLDEMRVWSPEYEIKMTIGVILSLLVAIRFGSYGGYPLLDFGWLPDAFRALALLPNDQERPVWGVVFLGVYAWWRGRSRAEPSVDSAFTTLRWGSVALFIAIIAVLVGSPDEAVIRERLSGVTVGFFAAALAGVGIARLKLEGVRSSAPLGVRWLGTFVVPILAVVVIATLAAGIFSRQFLDTVLWLLSPVFWVLGMVFQFLVLVIAVLAFIILTPIFWLIGDRELQFVQPTPVPDELDGQTGLEDAVGEAFQLPDPLRYLIAAIVLFAIFSLLTRFVFKRKGRSRPPTGEERESVLNWDDLLANAGERLRGLFRRDQKADPFAHLRGDDRWRHTLRIREVYLKLQSRGSDLGRARRRSETAEEYRPKVTAALGDDTGLPPAVDAITARYRRARYSGRPASAEDADIVEINWDTIERAPRPEQ
jgi:hypothetical protein